MASGGDDADNAWELSKENVQPLKSGRKMANLSAALQPHTADQMARLKEEQKFFENEIRQYSGDDALDPWYQYIEWLEQNFPTGGKDSHLPQLLETCVEKFRNEKHYHNDPRFIDIWIKFANLCSSPVEIYVYLFNQNIGCELAAFYEAWAWEYECAGNTKRAAIIYKQGIERGAQPLDLLRKKQEEFEARVTRKTLSGELAPRPPSPDLVRATLGQLKGHGKDKKAPANRAVPASQAKKVLGPRLNTHETPQVGGGGPSFSIHSDDAAPGPSLPPQTGDYASVPSKQTIKENEQKPGPWNKAKVKQKHLSTAASSSTIPSTPSFSIHEDPHTETPITTPRKPPESHPGLSAKKKNEPRMDRFAFYQQLIAEKPHERPMYDKYLVYGGVDEYSFEEIRAIRHLKRMKQQQQQQQKQAEEERVREQEQRMKEQEERMRERQEELHRAHQQEIRVLQEQLQAMASQLSQMKDSHSNAAASQQQQLQLQSAILQKKALLEETIVLHEQRQQHPQPQQLQQQQQQQQPQQQQHQPPPQQQPQQQATKLPFQIHSDDSTVTQPTKQPATKLPFQIHTDEATPMCTEPPAPASQPSFHDSMNQSVAPAQYAQHQQHDNSGMHRLSLNQSSLDSAKTPNTAEIMGFSVSKFNASATPNLSVGGVRGLAAAGSGGRPQGPTPDSMGLGSSGSRGRGSADSSLLRLSSSAGRNNMSMGGGGLTAPSPTVNMKNAMNVVMGMFNDSIHPGGEFGWGQKQDTNDDDFLEAQFAAPDSDSKTSGLSAPFAIYDENQASASKPASSAPFQIFEEKPAASAPFAIYDDQKTAATPSIPVFSDPAQKENDPSLVAKSNKGKRGLGGMLASQPAQPIQPTQPMQPVEEVYEVPMPDEDEVLSQQRDNELMDGIECGGDMTFAPCVASTCNFSEAARLASTPFNPTSSEKLPDPTISSIKVPLGEASSSVGGYDGSVTHGQNDVTPMEDPGLTRRASIFAAQQPNDLSPIMEMSDEANKSHAGHMHGQSAMQTLSTTTRHGSNTTASVSSSSSPPKMSMSAFQYSSNMTSGNHNTTSGNHGNQNTTSGNHGNHNTTSGNHGHQNTTSMSRSRTTSNPDPATSDPKSRNKSPSEEEFGDVTLHEIDVTNYVPASGDLDRTQALLNQSVAIDPHNPFDEELVSRFLSRLDRPIHTYPNHHALAEPMPDFQVGSFVALGNSLYSLKKLLGEGAYAKVFKAELKDANKSDFEDVDEDLDADEVVLKVQSPACPWEFYITTELHARLKQRFPDNNICSSVMYVDDGFFFTNGSCLVNELGNKGTLLDFVNLHKKAGETIHPLFLLYMTIELLRIAGQIQACHIIHGDIKPDNFLFKGMPQFESYDADSILSSPASCVRLIDFGRSIDMKQFPPNTTFLAKVNTSGFECIEMKTDRPWTWQTDMFGIIGTIHVLVFGKYMKVYSSQDSWKMTSKFLRYMTGGREYSALFHALLNIPSCDELPDLAAFRAQFQDCFRKNYNESHFCAYLKKVTILYHEQF